MTQKEDLPEGTLVITSNQKQGRGQQGNAWITEPGKNLTFSLILKPTFLAIKDQFLLNMVVSLAIRDFLQDHVHLKVYVKWPNDIIVDDHKLCGILIENQIQGSSFSNSVVGIGLNVNQRAFFSRHASSMSMLTSKSFDLQKMFEQAVEKLEAWYLLLRRGLITQIKDSYSSSLYGNKELRNFRSAGGSFEGKIEGVDDAGKLLIKTEDGLRYFNFKEVQFDFEPLK